MTGQVHDLGGPHEEEQVESDFFGDGNVADESEDHRARVFRVCACPLASNKVAAVWVAMQTIVGQVNSEFSGRCYEDDSSGSMSADYTETAAWEISGGKVKEWARTQRFQSVTSFAGGDPSNNSRAERCVGILKRMARTMLLGSGLRNCIGLWKLAASHAALCHRCSVQRQKVSWPRSGCGSVLENQGSSK